MERFTFRATPEQIERLKRLGGADWIRRQIDAATLAE